MFAVSILIFFKAIKSLCTYILAVFSVIQYSKYPAAKFFFFSFSLYFENKTIPLEYLKNIYYTFLSVITMPNRYHIMLCTFLYSACKEIHKPLLFLKKPSRLVHWDWGVRCAHHIYVCSISSFFDSTK